MVVVVEGVDIVVELLGRVVVAAVVVVEVDVLDLAISGDVGLVEEYEDEDEVLVDGAAAVDVDDSWISAQYGMGPSRHSCPGSQSSGVTLHTWPGGHVSLSQRSRHWHVRQPLTSLT